jgi:hypothetical protein
MEAEHVAQHERRALAGWQVLQRRDELASEATSRIA